MRKSRRCDIPSIFLDAPVKMTHHETYMNLWAYRGTVARYCWDSHWGYRMNTPRCGTCHSLNWFCSSDHGCHFPSMFFCLNWFKLCKDLQAMCVRLQDYIYLFVCTSSLDAFVAFRIPVLWQLLQHGGTIWSYQQLVSMGMSRWILFWTLTRRYDACEDISQTQSFTWR